MHPRVSPRLIPFALVALVALGCAATATPPAAPPRASEVREAPDAADSLDTHDAAHAPAASDVTEAPDAPDAHALLPCGADEVAFALDETTVDLACDPAWDCRGGVPFAVRNCTADRTLEVSVSNAAGGVSLQFEPLAPGAQVAYSLVVTREGEVRLAAAFTAGAGDFDVAVVRTARVTNTQRDRARAECMACAGEWGRHGMLSREGCMCRMTDRGNLCEDARDCEGECVPTGVRVVEPARPARRLGGGMVSPAVPARGVLVGRCSEFRVRYSCHTFIPEGARAAGPGFLPLRPSTRCVD